MNRLLFPPALLLRAVDDLHAIAELARSLTRDGEGPLELRRALDDLTAVGDAARRVPDIEEKLVRTEESILERVNGLEQRLDGLLALAERLEGSMPGISELLDRVDRVDAASAAPATLGESLDTLRESTAVLAAAVEPLQGNHRATRPDRRATARGASPPGLSNPPLCSAVLSGRSSVG